MELDAAKVEKVEGILKHLNDEPVINVCQVMIKELRETTEPTPDGRQSPHLSMARHCYRLLDYFGYRNTELQEVLLDLERDVSRKCDPFVISAEKQWRKG